MGVYKYKVVHEVSHQIFVMTASNGDTFSKYFHWRLQQKICGKVIVADPSALQMHYYVTIVIIVCLAPFQCIAPLAANNLQSK